MTDRELERAIRDAIRATLSKRYSVHLHKPNASILKQRSAVDAVFRKLPPISIDADADQVIKTLKVAIMAFEKEQGLTA